MRLELFREKIISQLDKKRRYIIKKNRNFKLVLNLK